MGIKEIVGKWEASRGVATTAREYHVQLPLRDAARVEALVELFPERGTQDILADLLAAALDELEATLPYRPGPRVVSEDEYGDPIYEDVGLTPRLRELAQKHARLLEQQPGEKERTSRG